MVDEEPSKARIVGFILAAFGALWALPSSGGVYNVWRIALHADQYRSAVMIMESVSYSRGTKNSGVFGYGQIEGEKESVVLEEFGDFSSEEELLRTYPPGSKLKVLYDPTASRSLSSYRYLRVISPNYPIQNAKSAAVRTTLKHDGLLLIGIGLILFGKFQERRNRSN